MTGMFITVTSRSRSFNWRFYCSISVLDDADVDVKDILNHLDVDVLNRRGGHDGYVYCFPPCQVLLTEGFWEIESPFLTTPMSTLRTF